MGGTSKEISERLAARRSGDVRILSEFEVGTLLKVAEDSRYPFRNRGIVLLATDAGMTPYEMSYLKRRHLLGVDGLLGEEIDLRAKPGKYLMPRRIPMQRHGRLWTAMHLLLENVPAVPDDPLIISERAVKGGKATKDPGSKPLRAMRSTSISYIFWKLMVKAGIAGASASTARTTFIARAGHEASKGKMSLRNVQELSGQRSLESVQRVLEADDEQKKVIIRDMFEDLEKP